MSKLFRTLLIAFLTLGALVALFAYKHLVGPIVLPENAWYIAAALIVTGSVLWQFVTRRACCLKT